MSEIALVLCALSVVGCQMQADESEATPSSEAVTQADLPSAAPSEVVAPPPAEPDPAAVADQQKQMQEVQAKLQAMEAVFKKASEAKGPTYCKKAYSGVEIIMNGMQKIIPKAVREVPPKAVFLKVCKSLPKPIQQCMVIKYTMDHPDECKKVQAGMRDVHKKSLEALLGSDSAQPSTAAPAPAQEDKGQSVQVPAPAPVEKK